MKGLTSIVRNKQRREPAVHHTHPIKVIAVIIHREVVAVAKEVKVAVARVKQTQEAALVVVQKDWALSPQMERVNNEVPAAKLTHQLLTTKASRSKQQH